MKIKKFLSAIVAGALAFTTLASMSTFTSSADEVFCGLEEDDYTIYIGAIKDIKYQTRTAENGGTEIRFVAEVMDEVVERAYFSQWNIKAATADAPDDFVEVETQSTTKKAYKSLIANGKKISAPEGCSYIISKKVTGFSNGDVVQGNTRVSMSPWKTEWSNYYDENYYSSREITIGGESTDSSSQAEESSESGLVIGDDEDSSAGEWGGNQNGGNGDSSSVVNNSSSKTDSDIPLIPALKDCKITCHTTPGEYGGADVFFVAEVKEDDYLSSIGYEWYIEAAPADDPENFVEVETQPIKAPTWSSETFSLELQCEYEYEADGITHKAPSGYVYLISDPVGSFNTGDHVYGEIFLLNFANACGKEVTIDCDTSVSNPDAYAIKMPEESSEIVEESSEIIDESSEIDSSSEADSSSDDNDESYVIWEGNAEINKWKGFETGVTNIPDAEDMGIIVIYATPIDSSKSAEVAIQAADQDECLENICDRDGNSAFEVNDGKAYFMLTAEGAQILRETNRICLNGTNVVITKVKCLPCHWALPPIWTGNEDLTSWTQEILIENNYPIAEKGGEITVYAESLGDNPQVQLSGIDSEGEEFVINNPATGNAYDLDGNYGRIVLDADSAHLIAKAKKLYLNGYNVKARCVWYTEPDYVF